MNKKAAHRPTLYGDTMVIFTLRVPRSLFKRLRRVSTSVVRGMLMVGLDELKGSGRFVKGKTLEELDGDEGRMF